MNTQEELQQFHCSEHRERPNEFLLLQRDYNGKKRLLCSKCLYSPEKNDWLPEIKESIPLHIAIEQPEKMIDKLTQGSQSQYLNTISNIEMKDLEKLFNEQILKFELLGQKVLSIKEELKEKLKEYKDRQEKIVKLKSEFLEKILFNSFCQLIHSLQELDKQFKSDQYQQIEVQISNIIDGMLKENCTLIRQSLEQTKQNHSNIINNVSKPKTDEIQSEITSQFKQYEEFIGNLNKDFALQALQTPEFKILSNEYFQTIQQKIEFDIKKPIKQMTLIFLGSRDGLNGNAYWSKVNGRKNLVMIFKSKNNNYVFGCYTPLQWQQQLSAYVQDDTLSSFLFSQTRNEIYPLKKDAKGNAIHCHSSNGPLFGGGHDLYIAADFTTGSQNIGNTYSTEKYQIQQYHLFGGAQPNIAECEIYELAFE